MDIDYAIRIDEPSKITDTSTATDIALYEKWERYNRLSLMFIKTKIFAGIRGSVDQHDKVQDLIKVIDDQFFTSEKALASILIIKFSSLKLTSVKGDTLIIVHITPQVQTGVEQPIIEIPQATDNVQINQVIQELPGLPKQWVEPQTSREDVGTTLRRSVRTKRSAIPSDYEVYLQELDHSIGAENDPESFSQAMSCKESELWYNDMKEEMSSMKSNRV
ncbi:unnamed protein product [Fraxinus pennsylvanica]|uniref:Uncharacterized protein n=1 Tax=Fraxinus pennsylvanica TaxID=56036 RepID=A0AAD1YQC3_9LAMI|nr:unnamed protein product [Fraxinus pennsylvanica]